MSDVNIAPPPASEPSPPQRNEVPIEQNPVSSPQPIGSQAPPAREGAEKPPTSRREAIQRALQKAEDAGRPGPAKARMGHNQPPEETPQEKLDLRKPPAKEPQHREGGKFARAPERVASDPSRQGAPGQSQPAQARVAPGQPHPRLPEGTPYRVPPPRFSPHAQAAWDTTPEPVRADIVRMHQEVDGMHRHYRADKEVMDTIRPFHQLATSQGTNLQRALHNYVNMEQKLRSDVIGGLDIIIDNLNLRTPDGRKLGLRDVAWHVLNTDPNQHKMMQGQHAQSALGTQIGQLHQMVQGLAQNQQRMQYERQFVQTRGAVDQFADTHPGFDELGDLIEGELRLGFSLEQAYQRARLLRPGTHAPQTRNTSAQTRPADKSISGAPSGSSNERGRGNGKTVGRRDAIRSAIRSVNGGM